MKQIYLILLLVDKSIGVFYHDVVIFFCFYQNGVRLKKIIKIKQVVPTCTNLVRFCPRHIFLTFFK